MRSTVISIILLALTTLLYQCNRGRSGKLLIPEQSNEFICIYKPGGDHFFGPDTENLKEGEFYEEWVPNDHTFIKDAEGKWHIFGITHPLVMTDPLKDGIHEGEFASFHAVSSKTRFKETLKEHHYTDLPKVLPPSERPGEVLANHAPYIVKKDNVYHMVYGHSPIRLAVSPDLYTWETQGEVFSELNRGDEPSALFHDARDPNLLVYNGTYYIVYCSAKSVRMRTSSDLINWSESSTIFTSKSYDPESPSLIFHNNTFYLFVCSWDGNWDQKEIVGAYQHKTYVLCSDDPYNFGNDSEKQITTLNAHAPEIFQDEEGQWYISSVEWPCRGVSVDNIKWEEK